MSRPVNQPEGAGSTPAARSNLVVAPCDHKAATHAVLNWHYSRTMPSGKLVKFGAWENGHFIGVVLFGRGASPNLGTPYGLRPDEVCELVRVALRNHVAPTSQVVAAAMKGLRSQSNGLRLIVSFADEGQDHLGVLYQAGSWIYAGSVNHTWLRVHGQLVHPKTLHSKLGPGGQSIPWLRANVDPHAERVHMKPKHRYLFPLDRQMRRKLVPLSRPYPKRS